MLTLASGVSSETVALRTRPLSEEFSEHIGKLLSGLEWIEGFPASVLVPWRDHVAALDVRRPRASLRLLAAISENYDEANRRFRSDLKEVSRPTQFAEQVRHIGTEIDQLIRILERALAYEARR